MSFASFAAFVLFCFIVIYESLAFMNRNVIKPVPIEIKTASKVPHPSPMVGYSSLTAISYRGTLISPLISSDFPTDREKSGPPLLQVMTRVDRNIAGKEPKIPPSNGPPSLPMNTAKAITPPPNKALHIIRAGG